MAGSIAKQHHQRLNYAAVFCLCECGGRSRIVPGSEFRSRLDAALLQATRRRECAACGNEWQTVEVRASELSELRRRAHLYEMAMAKSRRAVDGALERAAA